MSKYLLFQIYGAMQSWGEVAVGEIRSSAQHPTRSGIFGLMAACMGIRRRNEEALNALRDGYGFAFGIKSKGMIMLDYHTIQMPKAKRKREFYSRRDELGQCLDAGEKLNTMISRREYLTDAHFLICLWAKENAPHSLQDLAEGLRRPVFIPYLGRRSCPVCLPFFPQIMEKSDIQSALQEYDCGWKLNSFEADNSDDFQIHIDADAVTSKQREYLRRDMPAHFGRRQFWQRKEAVLISESEEDKK